MKISIAKLAKDRLGRIEEAQAEALADDRPVKLVWDAAAELKEKSEAQKGE